MISKGERVRVTLISTKTYLPTRISRGLSNLIHTGTAEADLREGESFVLGLETGFNQFITSPVVKVLPHTFTTENSTYQYEKLA